MPLESVSPSELLTYLVDTLNQRELQKLFNEYGDVQDNIILLHRLVEDAKARKDRDETRKDIWRDELEPRAAICARTVPQLEEETRRLKERLSKVRLSSFLIQKYAYIDNSSWKMTTICLYRNLDRLQGRMSRTMQRLINCYKISTR